jgi:hypothetical protein
MYHCCHYHIDRERLQHQVNVLYNQLQNSIGEAHSLRLKLHGAQKRKRQTDPPVRTANPKVTLLLHREVPTNYVPLDSSGVDVALQEAFGKLFTLQDILQLETHPHRTCLEGNAKFAKLVKIAPPVRALQGLVGLENIKQKAFDIIAHYTLNKIPKPADLMHMVIEGPPGVGKTEVGRLLGQVMLGLGVLTSDKFICAQRSDLIGEFLGQTAPRTQAVIDSAMGGILFIDEAYSLGHPDKRDSFSKECIDTLNQNLTEKKGQFLCIIAGYEDQLESCFFSVNQGLRRRFPVRMSIVGYTPAELHKIFLLKVAQDHWQVPTPEIAMQLFKEKHKYFHFFAGDTETLFAQAKFAAAGRLLRSSTTFVQQPTLTKEDVTQAYEQTMAAREKQHEPTYGIYT